MARINIEDSIYQDARFADLLFKMGGDIDRAIGSLVRAWSLAQKWYLTEDKMIPIEEWEKQRLPSALVESGLAAVVGNKVRVSGCDQQFSWLMQRHEAGRRGGLATQSAKRSLSDRQATVKQTQPSSSSSSSSSSSRRIQNTYSVGSKSPNDGDLTNKHQAFIAQYVKSWSARYNSRPALTGRVVGQVKTLLKDIPLDRATGLIQVYCQMDEPWFVKKCHDFGTFIENLGKVSIAMDTGLDPDNKDIYALIRPKEIKNAAP